MNEDSHGRVRLGDRIDALLANSSPRSSSDSASSLDSPTARTTNMRRALPTASQSKAPVLRWLSNLTNSNSQPPSPARSSLSLNLQPPSPSLSLLNEALNTPLILPSPIIPRPPLAKLPPSFRAAHNVTHPPPFFDNLTRSTLPTSSLSPPPTVSTHPVPQVDLARPPPIVLNHSPPSRTSLDSLRSLHTRSMTTYSITSITSLDSVSQKSSTTTSASWWSFQQFTKSNKDALLADEDRPQTQQQQQDLKNKYISPNNPIVFCHGLLGFDSVTIGPTIAPLEVTHWRGIKEVLEENGTEVLITRVPATSSPADRAKVLEEKISSVYPGRSVHLIGHSMGGLDCRYLTTHLTHRKFKVLSITTIATPHRGSSFADHFLSTVGRTNMPSVLSLLDLLPNGGGDGKAFECLTLASMRRFNEETPDVEGVRYFSWGAVYEPGLIDTWKWPHTVILEREGPNDGLVSVESSKWGTYLGTLSQVNHLDLVGWINTARYKWAEMMGKEIKFRPATFYMGIADMLAREVEGLDEGEGEIVGREEGADGRLTDSPKVGAGADLEGSELGESAQTVVPKKEKEASKEPREKVVDKVDKERAQMVDSLDAAGAEIQQPSSGSSRTATASNGRPLGSQAKSASASTSQSQTRTAS
ncbi:unnamed protein product [Cyclocybe aegerita]|uniref:GPI inositol-deacylase n=1 Tax=Cyclocybe aegerita TaxID=1973307 RepID=A0A8S0W9T3_CYCAE|nr:unnamed protein product [Cyclocybe aegerita]